MLIGVSNAPVIFLFEFVFRTAGVRIAALPEVFYERLTLVVGGEFLKGSPLFVSNNVGNFLAQPLLVGRLHFHAESLLAPLFCLTGFLGSVLFLVVAAIWREGMQDGNADDEGERDDQTKRPAAHPCVP